jgi:glycogen debranching enzyme
MTAPVAHVLAGARYAWFGPSLLITTDRGDCDEHRRLTGYYFREARHLSSLRLELNGTSPWLCADGSMSPRQLDFVYVYPELLEFSGRGNIADDATWTDEHGVTQRAIDVRLRQRVHYAGLTVTLVLANRSARPVDLEIAWTVGADFADIEEAFGSRQQQAEIREARIDDGLLFRYCHPKLSLATSITVAGPLEWTVQGGRLTAQARLDPRASLESTLAISPIDGDRDVSNDADGRRMRRLNVWQESFAAVDFPRNGALERIVRNAIADVASLPLLEGGEDEWLTPQAGIPLYPALFARDAFTAGWQAAMIDCGEFTDAALSRIGRMQSDRVDDWRDAQPGRLPYQVRHGPVTRLNLNPYSAYYADFASPFMFIMALGHAFAWSGRKSLLTKHWDTARRILDWARTYGDSDGDGFLEYQTRSSGGTKNQGWKDSSNSILYEDGTIVPDPLGTCELQGYWFAAQQIMAALNWALGNHDDAKALWNSALELKRRFNAAWWMEEEGFVALALDANKRLARSITSNVGHCLASGIIDDEHVPQVVERLFAPDMFSGWAIRTLSAEHPSYNPLNYHLGSVWPVENASIVFGLRRYGFDDRATALIGALFDLGQLYESGRIPECVGGYARTEFPQPGAYPRANPLQLWNQSAYVMLLQVLLGIQPLASLHTLVVDPALPPWLPEIIIRKLRVGGATATIRVTRQDDGSADVDVLELEGTLHVLRQPPIESLHATVADRLAAVLRSVTHT